PFYYQLNSYIIILAFGDLAGNAGRRRGDEMIVCNSLIPIKLTRDILSQKAALPAINIREEV
ncbi:MAG: hypothetical protein ACYS8Y_08755, partial [Planctomycetota bacterium]